MTPDYMFHESWTSNAAALAAATGATMTDVAPAPAPAEPAAPAPLPAPAPAPEPAPAEADPFDSGADSFPRAYVEKLRNEAAANRTAHKPYKDVFDGLGDVDRDAILGFVAAYKADPAAAGAIAKTWGEALTPAERGTAAEAAGAAETDAPMTRREFEAAMGEREQAAGVAASIGEMQREAKTLGYDPEGPEYLLLIQAMDRLGTTDMAAGHAEVEKFFQGRVDAYVAAKAQSAGSTPVAPAGGVAPSGAAEAPKDFGSIKSAAAEWLAHLN